MPIVDQYNFHKEGYGLKFTIVWIWLISQNLSNLRKIVLFTSLSVIVLKTVHIQNSHKILNIWATWHQGPSPLSQDMSSNLDVRILLWGPVCAVCQFQQNEPISDESILKQTLQYIPFWQISMLTRLKGSMLRKLR